MQAKPGPWFNIKISSYLYRKSHCGEKTVVRSSYLHNGISYTGKITSSYWIRAQNYHLPSPPVQISIQTVAVPAKITNKKYSKNIPFKSSLFYSKVEAFLWAWISNCIHQTRKNRKVNAWLSIIYLILHACINICACIIKPYICMHECMHTAMKYRGMY